MARNSIFDIVSDSMNIKNETERIIKIFEEEQTLMVRSNKYTILEYVDKYAFADWKWRGHCLDVDDFLNSMQYQHIVSSAKYYNVEPFLILIELVYNFWNLACSNLMTDDTSLRWFGNFFLLHKILDDNLQQFNHKAYFDDKRILIIEDKLEVTAVAEVVNENLAKDVIRYNHHSLRGDIETKKAILLAFGSELEPMRKELEKLNKQVSEDIFFALNNLNLRHNNCNSQDQSKYKEHVAKMNESELEQWYDEIYQLMLLAILLLDNMERTSKIKDLKQQIAGGSKNG